MEVLAGFSIIIVLFLFVLAILWCLVPFLIMGTNGRLDKIHKQNNRIIELLEQRKP